MTSTSKHVPCKRLRSYLVLGEIYQWQVTESNRIPLGTRNLLAVVVASGTCRKVDHLIRYGGSSLRLLIALGDYPYVCRVSHLPAISLFRNHHPFSLLGFPRVLQRTFVSPASDLWSCEPRGLGGFPFGFRL